MNYWTEEEYQILKEHYPQLSAVGVAKLLGRPVSSVHTKAWKLGIKTDKNGPNYRHQNREDLSHIFRLDDPFVVYFLGFLWADGTISKKTSNVRLKIVKPDFDKIKDRVMMIAKSWRFREENDGNPNHKTQSVLEINHKGLHAFLKSNDYDIKSGASPDKILTIIPEVLRHYWWRGYFDGDGCMVFDGATVRASIASCRKQDWNFAEVLSSQFGIPFRLALRDNYRGASGSSIHFEGEVAVTKFMNYILQGEPFGLSRKYDVYHGYVEHKKTVRPNKTSQYRGVCLSKGKWLMQIYKGKHTMKVCETELEAAQEYDRLAKILFGDKAYLNFPNV